VRTRARTALRSPLALAGVAAAGILAGHWIAYVLAFPGSVMRAHVLHDTGHSYWDVAVKVAVLALVVGLTSVVGRHLRARDPDSDPQHRVSFLAWRLIVIQVLGFALMEIGERLAAGAPVGDLFLHEVFLVGLALQVLIAVAGAALLAWFDRAVRRVVVLFRRSRRPARARQPRLLLPQTILRPSAVLAGGTGLRGPPRS
jgi:hypothetical protein